MQISGILIMYTYIYYIYRGAHASLYYDRSPEKTKKKKSERIIIILYYCHFNVTDVYLWYT